MSSDLDHRYMGRAIQLAKRGWYTTQPNPRVGCVLVKDGEIVGEGYHRRAGELHAERNALADAGEAARGATAYVTLEPCCHQGRTPPCTEGLIEAGVKRVVAAMTDPNPKVAGKGFEQLEQAGIEVVSGVLEAQAAALNPGFIKRMRQGLPYVRCKMGMSLDGRTAMANGESQWITSAESRVDVHKLRAASNAILTGVGTLLADDPSMNVRVGHSELGIDEDLQIPGPVRVVLDPQLQTPASAKMLNLPGQTLVVCSDDNPTHGIALEAAGAQVVTVPAVEQGLDLHEVLQFLADQEINEILLESGATLAGAMLEQGLVDELIIYQAPHLMGDSARGLFRLPGIQQMSQRLSLNITDVRQIGPDIRITATPRINEDKPRFRS
ncbi:MAG: bifunctional diaminohydroxyphosphoribosylaminopyrimidine deaminase/5-amino-6-(5-phosphoribosylamino)uracil reductase RibD [Candidatus Thiodiazotropha weberae]|nr:bifunctional diaminohydroxyphosphoribosylaminopyrimidine deaminase/5-amino-6-(5-phosphoribosylamino)uracil reductase RibD [Candidatus Thiodiazotropha lotti]MCG8014076.1 bifunctional diaminohydroxyphosphoribosylaminopyrimidine deaminase/5-amino-6-(5-phosphoribosylamino)uracil reductase RibD [Candidatus Thiodiazotropha lotti]MCG8021537.1 bifunctional diaminohydroxyphosphoribosylaminopyrimidine deaminase/5-amino-6-(5-phosphoribosylamino)uracil reductase RibD [Candidatus Thiodiazotropha lotti]MCW